jgi:hypothetical protein
MVPGRHIKLAVRLVPALGLVQCILTFPLVLFETAPEAVSRGLEISETFAGDPAITSTHLLPGQYSEARARGFNAYCIQGTRSDAFCVWESSWRLTLSEPMHVKILDRSWLVLGASL